MLCWPGKIKRGVVSFYFLDLGLVSDVFIRAVIFGGAKVMVYNCNLMKTGKVGLYLHGTSTTKKTLNLNRG
jgi:hypothetical protein